MKQRLLALAFALAVLTFQFSSAAAFDPTAWERAGAITSSTTLTITSPTLNTIDSTSGSVTVTLPSAASMKGKPFAFKKIGGTNAVSLTRAGSDTIDSSTSIAFSTSVQNQIVVLESDGTSTWRIILNSAPPDGGSSGQVQQSNGAGAVNTWLSLSSLPNVAYTNSNNSFSVAQLPNAAGTIDLGSTSFPFRDLFLRGAGSNYARFLTASLNGNRTVNIPNADSTTVQPDTGAANNWISAISAQGVITKSQPASSNLSDSSNIPLLNAANTFTNTNITRTLQAAANNSYDLGVDSSSGTYRSIYISGDGLGASHRLIGATPSADRVHTFPNADSNTVIPDTGAANNFLTAISSAGVISKAQPSTSNLSDGSNIVKNNQSNTYSTGTQDFTSATGVNLPTQVQLANADTKFTRSSAGTFEVNGGTAGNYGAFNSGNVNFTSISSPSAAPTLTIQGTSGATTRRYRFVANFADGSHSPISAENTTTTSNATLTGSNFVRITFSAVSKASYYTIYRTTSGGTPSTLGKIGTTTSTTFDDTGLAGDGNVPSTTLANTTGAIKFYGTSGTVLENGLKSIPGTAGNGTTINGYALIAGTYNTSEDYTNLSHVWTSKVTAFKLGRPAIGSLTTNGSAGSTTYKYRVTAVDLNMNESNWSPEVTIATGNATLTGSNSINININGTGLGNPGNNPVAYRVYRTASSGTPSSTGAIGYVAYSPSVTFIDTGIAATTTTPYFNKTGNIQASSFTFSESGLASAMVAWPAVNGCRLSAVNTAAVPTSDQSSVTTLYLVPYTGRSVTVINSENIPVTQYIGNSTISLSLSGKAVGMYDVFVYDSDGMAGIGTGSDTSLALEMLAWTNTTTRATSIVYDSIGGAGFLVKNGDNTRRFVGSVYISSTGTTKDTAAERYIYNYNNRVLRDMVKTQTGTSWTYSTKTWRQMNNGTGATQVSFVTGIAEDAVSCQATAFFSASAINRQAYIGIGLDSTSTNAAATLTGSLNINNSSPMSIHAFYNAQPGVGLHTLYPLEAGSGTATTTFYGSGNDSFSVPGITAKYPM